MLRPRKLFYSLYILKVESGSSLFSLFCLLSVKTVQNSAQTVSFQMLPNSEYAVQSTKIAKSVSWPQITLSHYHSDSNLSQNTSSCFRSSVVLCNVPSFLLFPWPVYACAFPSS